MNYSAAKISFKNQFKDQTPTILGEKSLNLDAFKQWVEVKGEDTKHFDLKLTRSLA